ncbi:alpha-L-rhamnosidase [Sphingomonas sp. KC8]|uniref:alpha-L-rhamnosidase n=1 Tax=Sphingomonas sp. KC8 TaxID=1030157 RepID=UPI0002E75B71|nr:alpha-L-rhamnosidase [Sphingomonas sp. KC8]ARS26140.1 alpha-L-rhamnosidase [Sphingomonas sp. KC8]
MEIDRRGAMALGFGAISPLGQAVQAGTGKKIAQMAVVDMRVCALVEPLALADHIPYFSWKLAAAPGSQQAAFRVIVARAEADLANHQKLVWDSGRIASTNGCRIKYSGPAMPARTRLWWRVEIWDAHHREPTISRPSFWETGLVSPDDWSAQWLACETEAARLDRKAGINWISGSGAMAVGQERYYRTTIQPDDPTTAELFLSGTELSGLWLNGQPLVADQDDPVRWTRMARYRLVLPRGRNVIAAAVKRASGFEAQPPALAAILRLGGPQGPRLTTAQGWTTSLTATPGWLTTAFNDTLWETAVPAAKKPVGEPWPAYSAVLLRHGFDVARPVRSAHLHATALGVYDAWINGSRVGDARMAPQSTDTSRRILFQTYDVTAMLHQGANAIGLCVGDGWYGSEYSAGPRFAFGPAPCRVRAQLEITYEDGSTQVIASGEGWKTASSPILASEIYDGEAYDARLEQSGWTTASFADAGWRPAEIADTPDIAIDPQLSPPIRVTRVLKPVTITTVQPGIHVFDFGQNFAGWPRLRVRGDAGTRIEMRFSETLKASGEIDQSNLRTAAARDIYILKGEGEEVWEPRFTYHGFRYVELRGLPYPPTAETLQGLVGHIDLPITGTFRVGDPVIQRFWQNSVWSQRSNFFGLPTDCPQRDERLGWMGDAEVFWPAAAYNMDIEAYTARVMGDMRRGQSKSGGFPDVIPPFMPGMILSSPGWADAGIILPYTAWRQYGGTGVIEDNWAAMERYMAWILDKNPDHRWVKSRGADYGDWLAVDAKQPGDATTPKDLIGTAFWAADARMMAEMAIAIGKPGEASGYHALFERIRSAFLNSYVDGDGRIGNGSQTGYVLAIRFGLLSPEARLEAGRRLAADIAARGNKLSTGFLGTPHILDALAASGQERTAITLLLQREYPSWGYMVEQGATTMWERWNSDRGDVSMNSYNHYAFGAIGDFLFRRIAGIEALEPGFSRVRIAPILDPRLRTAGADYMSSAGLIRTNWRYDKGASVLDVTLPANMTGEVVLTASPRQIALDGRPLASHQLAKLVQAKGATTIEIGAGHHRFAISGGPG